MSQEEKKINQKLVDASGNVTYPASDRITSFFYLLLRDAVTAGDLEHVMREIETDSVDGNNYYSNGWLADYAHYMMERFEAILKQKKKPTITQYCANCKGEVVGDECWRCGSLDIIEDYSENDNGY